MSAKRRQKVQDATGSEPTSFNQFGALRQLKKAKNTATDKVDDPVLSTPVSSPGRKKASVASAPAIRAQEQRSQRDFAPTSNNLAIDDEHMAVGLLAGQAFGFQGVALIACLVGSASVWGFTFSADHTNPEPGRSAKAARENANLHFHLCFSPKSSSFAVVKSVSEQTDQSGNNHVHASTCRCDSKEAMTPALKALTSRLVGSFDTVLIIKSVAKCGVLSIQVWAPPFRDLFTKDIGTVSDDSPSLHLHAFHPIFGLGPDSGTLSIPRPWSEKFQAVSSVAISAVRERMRFCIVGNKGVGKSTFARHLVNTLLTTYNEIAYLDCDLGQPELTASGVVSLNIIQKPLLGPPFTHISHPRRSCFLGTTSAKTNPDYFLDCIFELYMYYKDHMTCPLVINTNGWVKGMGLDLLLHLIRTIRPDQVICLGSGDKSVYGDVTMGLNTNEEPVSDMQITDLPGFDESFVRPSKINSADLRTLSMVSYFSKMQSQTRVQANGVCVPTKWPIWFADALTATIPYAVPFSAVRLNCINGEVPISQTLRAMNGTIVALISDSTPYEDAIEHDNTNVEARQPTALPRIIPSHVILNPKLQNFVGYGILRAIDVESGTYYINTPVPSSLLDTVNLITRASGMEIPANFFTRGFESPRSAVY
ncbi:Polynucleotide 5'-hydroxyl-kinase nol9 [Blyttiomyces sp. JEL0837]|nr:Polynucleotide 5'-hydroxyl-kinase nol9 [Blyttiomyces sp. JEL0837]